MNIAPRDFVQHDKDAEIARLRGLLREARDDVETVLEQMQRKYAGYPQRQPRIDGQQEFLDKIDAALRGGE